MRSLTGRSFALAVAAVLLTCSSGDDNARPATKQAHDDTCAAIDTRAAAVWNDDRKKAIATAFAKSRKSGFALDSGRRIGVLLDTGMDKWSEGRRRVCRAETAAASAEKQKHAANASCYDRMLQNVDALAAALEKPGDEAIERGLGATYETLLPLPACARGVGYKRPEITADKRDSAASAERLTAEATIASFLGESDRAQTIGEQATRHAEASGNAGLLARALVVEGSIARNQNRLPRAIEKLDLAREEYSALGDKVGEGEAALERAKTLAAAGAYKLALTTFDTAANLIADAVGDDSAEPALALIMNEMGMSVVHAGQPRAAGVYLDRAYELARGIYGDDHPSTASILVNLAAAKSDSGRPDKAIELLQRVLEIQQRSLGEKHPALAITLNNLGTAWASAGKPNRAVAFFERAYEHTRTAYGDDDHPHVALSLLNLGSQLDTLGRHDEALAKLTIALEQLEKIASGPDTRVASALNNIGSVWSNKGDSEKAIEYYERALVIDRQVHETDHPDVALHLNNIATELYKTGQLDTALKYFEQALAIEKNILGEEHPTLATTLNNLGAVWAKKGEHAKALALHEKSLALLRNAYGDDHPDVYLAINNIAVEYGAMGDYTKAIAWYEKALAGFRKVFGDDHEYVRRTRANIQKTRAAQQKR